VIVRVREKIEVSCVDTIHGGFIHLPKNRKTVLEFHLLAGDLIPDCFPDPVALELPLTDETLQTGYAQMIEWTTKLNTPGEALAEVPAVHALTDVTGFGLAGHLLEICRGSKLSAEVKFDSLPVIPEALDWVKQGIATGASTRNWAGYGHEVDFSGEEWKRKILTDPQTSGGLLVACAPDAEKSVLEVFRKKGFGQARVIGRLATGPARISVT
jgi:selenide, water dikinase